MGYNFLLNSNSILKMFESINKVNVADIFTSRKEEIYPSLKCLTRALSNKSILLFDISSNALCP